MFFSRLDNASGFSLLNVVMSVGLIVTLLVTLLPVYTANARLQRTATERIQVLWSLHGVLEQSRMGVLPTKTGLLNPDTLATLFPGFVDSVEMTVTPVNPRAVRVELTVKWVSLQHRTLTETLAEIIAIPGGAR